MKQGLYLFIISFTLFTLASCAKNYNAESGISEVKRILKEDYQKETDFIVKSAEARIEFFKSVCELSDEDFKSIYPQIKSWKREAREQSVDQVNKLNVEYDALAEKIEKLYSSISKRVESCNESIDLE